MGWHPHVSSWCFMPLPCGCPQAISWGYYGQQFCPNVDASAGDLGVLPVAFVSAPPTQSPAFLRRASPRSSWPQPQTPTWALAGNPVSDPSSSEKLLCGAMKGGGGGGGRGGCPREGMLFSSSLLFPGLLMSKLRGCYKGQDGRRQG